MKKDSYDSSPALQQDKCLKSLETLVRSRPFRVVRPSLFEGWNNAASLVHLPSRSSSSQTEQVGAIGSTSVVL